MKTRPRKVTFHPVDQVLEEAKPFFKKKTKKIVRKDKSFKNWKPEI